MPENSTTDLRLDPDVLPRVAAAYERAALQVGAILNGMHRSGRIPAWTEDPISIAMAQHYNEVVFGTDAGSSPYSTYGAIRTYRDELLAARETLLRIHADYLSNEAESASRFS